MPLPIAEVLPIAKQIAEALEYASASTAGDTLLFVGEDFLRTDIVPA